MRVILNLIIFFFFFACSEENPIYSKEEIYHFAKKNEPNAQLIIPSNMNDVINCFEYGEGCKAGHRVLIKEIELIAVEFETSSQAKNAAKSINAWVARNWLFDDVTGEPVLEKFIKEAFPESEKIGTSANRKK